MLAGIPLVTAACSSDLCTTEAEPAVVVTIVESVTGRPLAAGARGAVASGVYEDSLRPYITNQAGVLVALAAANERAGIYTVSVEHDGFESWLRANVVVQQGECGVNRAQLIAELVPVTP